MACSKKGVDKAPVQKTLTVTTLAGSGVQGSLDGTGSQASFSDITALAIDGSGNLYLPNNYLDGSNSIIRKVTPNGVVSTVTDNGLSDYRTYTTAFGIAVDNVDNIYVSYFDYPSIRKVTPQGTGTVLATVTSEFRGLQQPAGLAVDAMGDIYVAGYSSSSISKILPNGLVNNLSGMVGRPGFANGALTVASFNDPYGVAVDVLGNIYVADTGNNMIRKISVEGIVTTLAGSGVQGRADGLGVSASFYSPTALAVDNSGNVYVADTNNNLIRKVTSNGMVYTLAGTGAYGAINGNATTATFSLPAGIAVDKSGNVYVADRGNNIIRKISQQ